MERREFMASMLLLGADAIASSQTPLLLANTFRDDIDIADYWVSEKYDGVRALWNGQELLSRAGNAIQAPAWFIDALPGVSLDGELWIARGAFETVLSTVRDAVADEPAWRAVRFMVFDLPQHPGPFDERLQVLQRQIGAAPPDWLRVIEQFRVPSRMQLFERLDRIVAQGGEGLMLHRGDSVYRAERSDDLLKLKPHHDAEARVIDHLPGKGKYEGMLGALRLQRPDGLQFNLGTGFTDAQRRQPPPIGSWVTYSYHGLTENGVPRFARFLRTRPESR